MGSVEVIQGNIWKLYVYKFLNEFWIVAPILIPFYQHNGLDATQVFVIQASYALWVLLMEVPSGYLADVVGRRKSLILGAVFLPLGVLVYSISSTFWAFILAEFIIALGNSMRSGADSALLYDTLLEIEKSEDYQKVEGRTFFYTRIGTALSSILGGVLAMIHLRWPFYINTLTAFMILPFALAMVEPKRTKPVSKNPLKEIIHIALHTLKDTALRRLVLLSALILSTGVVGIWSYFLFYKEVGIPIAWFGLLFAITQLGSALGARQAHRLEKWLGSKYVLNLIFIIPVIFISLGLFNWIGLLIFIPLNTLAWGISYPLLMDRLNRLIQSDIRATVLSVSQMMGSFSYVILAPLFGFVVKQLSLSRAYLLMAVFFIVSAIFLLHKILRQK